MVFGAYAQRKKCTYIYILVFCCTTCKAPQHLLSLTTSRYVIQTSKQMRQKDQHTEGPHVRLAAELAVLDDLRGRPLDGELGALGARVLIIKNKSAVGRVDAHHYTAARVSRRSKYCD